MNNHGSIDSSDLKLIRQWAKTSKISSWQSTFLAFVPGLVCLGYLFFSSFAFENLLLISAIQATVVVHSLRMNRNMHIPMANIVAKLCDLIEQDEKSDLEDPV